MLHHNMFQLCNKICVNHCICNVVNSPFFLICVNIHAYITYTPLVAPAHPAFTAQLHVSCNVMTCGESSQTDTFHQHTEGVSNINALLVFDNCYGISCHAKAWSLTANMTSKMCWPYNAYYSTIPIGYLVIGRAAHGLWDHETEPIESVQRWTVHRRCLLVVAIMSQSFTSLAHELQNIYEIYFCSSAWNGKRRGSHHVLNFLKRNLVNPIDIENHILYLLMLHR